MLVLPSKALHITVKSIAYYRQKHCILPLKFMIFNDKTASKTR